MNEKTSKLFAITATVLFILWLAFKRAQNANVSNVLPNSMPEVDTTPGMVTDPWYMNGADAPIATPGNSDLSINIDPWSSLNQQYMPLFGFVGVSSTAYQ